MKTAVSIPDPLFEAAEQLAKRLRMPRSRSIHAHFNAMSPRLSSAM